MECYTFIPSSLSGMLQHEVLNLRSLKRHVGASQQRFLRVDHQFPEGNREMVRVDERLSFESSVGMALFLSDGLKDPDLAGKFSHNGVLSDL